MLDGLKRTSLSLHRQAVRLLSGVSIFGVRQDGVRREELLNAMLEGLHVARDTKALVVAKDGIIIQMNALASQLCGLSLRELHCKPVSPELFEEPRAVRRSAAIERWETGLKAATGELIPVEVVRHPVGNRFQDVVVYAVRDLRERHEAIEERHRQRKRLEQQDDAVACPECAFRYGHQQHAYWVGDVRCRQAPGGLQQALCGTLWPVAGAGETGYDNP